jgi:hypothetical protein
VCVWYLYVGRPFLLPRHKFNRISHRVKGWGLMLRSVLWAPPKARRTGKLAP